MATFFGGLGGDVNAHEDAFHEHWKTAKLAYAAYQRAKDASKRDPRIRDGFAEGRRTAEAAFTARKNAADVIELCARVLQETNWYRGEDESVRRAERMMKDAKRYLVGSAL